MATVSTKRRSKKKKTGSVLKAAGTKDYAVDAPETFEVSQKFWLVSCIIILAVAAALRLYAPELKPMHHDEGVNGFFLTNLVKRWEYVYQPDNYHGPTLYYFALPFTLAFGLKTWAVRLVPVIFGLGTVALVLYLRRYVGTIAALTAAALLAVSPGAVYYSRYFIHEMMFVFFTVGIVVAALKFYEERPVDISNPTNGIIGAACAVLSAALALVVALYPQSFGSMKVLVVFGAALLFVCALVVWTIYEGDRALYLFLAAVSTALMFATKETAFISAGVLVLAALIGRGWVMYLHGDKKNAPASLSARARAGGSEMLDESGGIIARVGGWSRLQMLLVAGVAVFIFVNVVFYSSFFNNPKGVTDSLQALKIWSKTGTSEFHGKPWYMYLKWLLDEEAPILLLGALGSAVALWLGRNRFAIFAGAWAFGMMAAYSLVKYKTPWLVLSFTVPMSIVAGYAVSNVYAWNGRRSRLPAALLVTLAISISLYQTLVLNFREYDNDRYPYVYSHTRRDFNALVKEIDAISERAGTATDTRIVVASQGPGADSYWPLPWYLNEYRSVGYYGQIPADAPQSAIIVGNLTQDALLRDRLAATHRKVGGTYQLRPGVDLVLYAKREYAGR